MHSTKTKLSFYRKKHAKFVCIRDGKDKLMTASLLSVMCAKAGTSTDHTNVITCQTQFIARAFSMTSCPSPE